MIVRSSEAFLLGKLSIWSFTVTAIPDAHSWLLLRYGSTPQDSTSLNSLTCMGGGHVIGEGPSIGHSVVSGSGSTVPAVVCYVDLERAIGAQTQGPDSRRGLSSRLY